MSRIASVWLIRSTVTCATLLVTEPISRLDPYWGSIDQVTIVGTPMGTKGTSMDPSIPASSVLWVFETLPYGRKPIPRMIFGGVFERFPNLKVVYTEHMGNWWGLLMEDMDSLGYMTGLSKLPSEYAKQSIFIGASFQSRKEAIDCMENDYWQNVIWGNDYPHPEGTWPESQRVCADQFDGVSNDDFEAIVSGNAAKVFGFDLDQLAELPQPVPA